MKKARLTVVTTIIITLLIAFVSFLVPVPKNNNPFDFYFNLTVAEATALFSIGASVVIVMGFDTFTQQFRRAYTIMFTGLIIWGVSYLLLPLIVALNQLNNNLFLSGTTIPFLGSVMLIFAGTRMLVKLFNVKTITTSWLFAFGVVTIIVIITVLAPHAYTKDELGFDTANALIMAVSTFFAICAYNILLIKRQASVVFTNAFAWLCISMFMTAFLGGYGSTFSTMIFNDTFTQLTNFLAIAPSYIGAVLFLRSAYSFNQIAQSSDVQGQFVARDFFGHPIHPKTSEHISSIDIVVYEANLASTHEAIDTLLDPIRYITAQLPENPQLPLPAADEETLKQTYLKIENYLLTKEVIRKFTKENLRQDIAQKLRLTPESSLTFWNTLA